MNLQTLLKPWFNKEWAHWDRPVRGLCLDSRQVKSGDVYCACQGTRCHGQAFILQAIEQGACAVLCEIDAGDVEINPAECDKTIPIIKLPHLSQQLGRIAADFYGHPSRSMNVIGVTGTNGKTTCTHFIAQSMHPKEGECAVLGTLGYGRLGALTYSGLTTQDAISLQKTLSAFKEDGVSTVAMEVSSHSLEQGRVNGVAFDTAIFTNLTQDHLDYHGTMKHYWAAKQKLFSMPGLKQAIINVGDPRGLALYKRLKREGVLSVYGFSAQVKDSADVMVEHIEESSGICSVHVKTPWGAGCFRTSLAGQFMLENILATLAVLGVNRVVFGEALARLECLSPVAGRMQHIVCSGVEHAPAVVVDYAHTPDALEKVLGALRARTQGQLYCVMGCGGDRDSSKRPIMGRVAEQGADRIILTNDNPRAEAPLTIIGHIKFGLSYPEQAQVCLDRRQAIMQTIRTASKKDCVLIAGKGHEAYQEIGHQRHPFSDADIARQAIAARGWPRYQGVSIDTRTLKPGELFFAIVGEHLDGHDYIQEAEKKGAAGVVLSHHVETSLPQIRVSDTTQALGELAKVHRKQFNSPLVALTGSYGKTTTKTMVAAILARCGQTLSTQGTLNNHWGVPLTLLRLNPQHRYAVVEMGANHPGEIATLTALAQPDVALLTNAGPAHLEGFGDLEGVARAKGEIFQGLSQKGTAVLNSDDAYFSYWRSLIQPSQRIISFGFNNEAQVTAKAIKLDGQGHTQFELVTPKGSIAIDVPLPGRHQVSNALAAAAVALALDVELDTIQSGLSTLKPVDRRLVLHKSACGARLMDDTYNANLASTTAALEWLADQPGQRILVFGDMLELGKYAIEQHLAIGERARQLGIERLYAWGQMAHYTAKEFGSGGRHFEDKAQLINVLKKELSSDCVLLAKGSNGMAMWEVIDALR